MKRREFLKNSLTISAVAGLSTVSLSASAGIFGGRKQEYYELRAYRLKAGASHAGLDEFLEKLAIPTWNQAGAKTVGVFTEKEPKGTPTVFVLIPHPSLRALRKAAARLNAAISKQANAVPYLQAPKDNPGFARLDSWLLRAFAGMPRLELPAYSREKQPRIFELRTYESHSELKALKKVAMFNSGEIQVMREVGLGPVFYGQALIGPNLPHLTYLLSAESDSAHKQHWEVFGKNPVWNKMKNDPQYADTVSKITNWFLVPTSYSQI